MSNKFKLAAKGTVEIDDGAYNRTFRPGESFEVDDSELARIRRFGLSESFTAETAKETPAASRKVAKADGGGE